MAADAGPSPSAEAIPSTGGTVAILGRGRVGHSLAAALTVAAVPVRMVASRDDLAVGDGVRHAELVVLAVPDDMIARTAERVVRILDPAASGHRPGIVHLSGASELDALSTAQAAGLPVGSFHPVAAFPDVRPPSVFDGAAIGIEASDTGLERRLADLARALHGHPRVVEAGRRAQYHAAAAMASNFMVALAAQATELLQQAGFGREDALQALLPLMTATVDNLREDGVPDALSGPIRRGDVGTVARHLEALDETAPHIAATYRALATPTIDLAAELGLGEDTQAQLRAALDPRDPEG